MGYRLEMCRRTIPGTQFFLSDGYGEGAGVAASDVEIASLASLYAGRTLYQGDMHGHAKTLGKGDDGSVNLTTWANSMAGLNLDFAASLDHHQSTHFGLTTWDESKLLYGTEAGTIITDRKDTSLEGKLHYNMIFSSDAGLKAVLNAFSDFTDTSKMNAGNALTYIANAYEFGYPSFTRARMATLIQTVQDNGGFFVHAHPTQTSYAASSSLEDYWFADYVGFEVLYINTPLMDDMSDTEKAKYAANGAYGTAETTAHYNLWNKLLKAGKRLYATAGSDTHGELNTYALTSVYSDTAKANADKGEIINQLRAGDFVAGAVGIKMSIGTQTMGGEIDFDGQRLIVGIGEFHESVVKSGHKYRVDILSDNGIVYSQFVTPGQELTLAIDASENSSYYRVEVVDATAGCRIAIGNPIWNK